MNEKTVCHIGDVPSAGGAFHVLWTDLSQPLPSSFLFIVKSMGLDFRNRAPHLWGTTSSTETQYRDAVHINMLDHILLQRAMYNTIQPSQLTPSCSLLHSPSTSAIAVMRQGTAPMVCGACNTSQSRSQGRWVLASTHPYISCPNTGPVTQSGALLI